MKLQRVFPILITLLILFTTSCKKDEEISGRPSVSSTDPADKATGITINTTISATFSGAMDRSTITNAKFTLRQGMSDVSGTVMYTGNTATFTPDVSLAPTTVCTATISTGAKDPSGKSMAKDFSWSFTTVATPDITLPTVKFTDPENSAQGISLRHPIVATFSEAMDPKTISTLTFTLTQGSTLIVGAVTYAGAMATFTPASNLEPDELYVARITTGVTDKAGNALAKIQVFSFMTGGGPDTVRPTVNSTDPVNNVTGVARNKVVAITFSEPMDPFTINASTFTLNQGSTAVFGTLAYSGTTASFTPSAVLAAGMTYNAVISTGIKDVAGNALAANTVLSFTTGGSSSPMAAVNLGAAGNYVILAKSEITNISTSAVSGDVGLSPAATSYITGFAVTNATGYATSSQVTGKIYASDMAAPTPINLTTAVNNMLTAYNDAAGRPSPDFIELGTGNIGGKTLAPGLYKWTSTVTMPSNVTISGSASDVWIFQIAGNLTVSSAVNVTLGGGAQAKNIFWQVAGEANLGTTSHFEGNILSMTGITFQTGASMNGRALAQTAAILDSNAVTKPQ